MNFCQIVKQLNKHSVHYKKVANRVNSPLKRASRRDCAHTNSGPQLKAQLYLSKIKIKSIKMKKDEAVIVYDKNFAVHNNK